MNSLPPPVLQLAPVHALWLTNHDTLGVFGQPVTLRQVADDPAAYAHLVERVLDEDLLDPIQIAWDAGEWGVEHGLERLLKAVLLGEPTIRARISRVGRYRTGNAIRAFWKWGDRPPAWLTDEPDVPVSDE